MAVRSTRVWSGRKRQAEGALPPMVHSNVEMRVESAIEWERLRDSSCTKAHTEFRLLNSQQAAAKEAARSRFAYPARATAHDQVILKQQDDLPRFTRGVEGIGIADDAIRVYVLRGHEDAVEIPPEFEGLRTESISTTGFRILARRGKPRSLRSHAACLSATTT